MPQAILSVSDKTGIVSFASGLLSLGWTLIASGGTARTLRKANLNVTEVAEYTASPEILSGRVKTLHPAIHGGIMARNISTDLNELHTLGWETIELVAVNLYPFETTILEPGVTTDNAIEHIDVGGVTLIRAAGKNHERVTLVCDPSDYSSVLNELTSGGVSVCTRRRLAAKGFAITAHYDSTIADYFSGLEEQGEGTLNIKAYPVQKLRYGENPHQSATLYALEPNSGPLGGTMLQGKELSYNNLLDLDTAWRAVVSFENPTVCIVKHLSPSGIASGEDLVSALRHALASDTVSAFGGVIATNAIFDLDTVEALGDLFVECIAAPGFTSEALSMLSLRENCRVIEMPDTFIDPSFEIRSIMRGFLRQSIDLGDPGSSNDGDWEVTSIRTPTELEWVSLRFAWKACQYVKSNAIVLVQGEATVGIGGGQPNRVDCVRIAAQRAGKQTGGSVMASDAFVPFPDSIEIAAEAGVTAIIQPGGSVRDLESIAAADAAGMAMVFTGVRHFRH